jgi:RNA polymerase sigma factor (sigma-70 family)
VDEHSTAFLQGQLERAVTGDAEARQRLLELTRDRLTRHARRLLHGGYARLEPFEQNDDVVQQLYVKVLQNQDRFWLNADGEPVRSLAELFGHASAWMRDVLCDLLRKAYGRDDNRPAVLPLDGASSATTARHELPAARWTELHEEAARLPDQLRAVFDLLWYQELSQAEAAALLGIALRTLKLRWMKARLWVQQALGGSPFDEPGSPPWRPTCREDSPSPLFVEEIRAAECRPKRIGRGEH